MGEFEVGQEIVVSRALGEGNRGGREYIMGGNTGKVPLGTKGIIDKINRFGKIHLKLESRDYGDGGGWWVDKKEIEYAKEYFDSLKEGQKKENEALERILLQEEPLENKNTKKDKLRIGKKVTVVKNLGVKKGIERDKYYYGQSIRSLPLGTTGIIADNVADSYEVMIGGGKFWFTSEEISLFKEDEKEKSDRLDPYFKRELLQKEESLPKVRETKRNLFNPKFNPREEFAVWVRDEFPTWDKKEIVKRREEIYSAAKRACEHGLSTSDDCVRSNFIKYLGELSDFYNSENFSEKIVEITGYIEKISMNLTSGVKHYGNHIASERGGS